MLDALGLPESLRLGEGEARGGGGVDRALSRYTNSVIAIDGTTAIDALIAGQPGQRYDKHHLVPFGEFIPPGFAWFVRQMQIPLGDFSRGRLDQSAIAWQGQRLSPNICYEDLYGEELASRFTNAALAPTVLIGRTEAFSAAVSAAWKVFSWSRPCFCMSA